jgi:signal transduction histidine kinase
MLKRCACLLALAVAHIATLAGQEAADSWLHPFSPELRALDRDRDAAEHEFSALGAPVVGQTAPQFGYQHPRVLTPPLTPPWVQVDLQDRRTIDWIVLVPAVLDWQSDRKPTYGFPPRFRIDVSDQADFASSTPVSIVSASSFTDPGVAPVAVSVHGLGGRFVRITVTELAQEDGQYFYALAELMVIVGKRNVAVGRPVSASATLNIPPRWALDNLVDGRTPLGPPIGLSLLQWDGLFAGATPEGDSTAMDLDLGRPYPLQEVRIYAVHARLGADIPGFSFPKRFRLEAADAADFSGARTLFAAEAADFPNPGDNAVTVNAEGVTARYLRFCLPKGDHGRFGLSEIEVYSDDRNVARAASVSASRDPSGYSGGWPKSLLVDGYTSYGRLKELPDWLAEWDRRAQLHRQLARLADERGPLAAQARRRAYAAAGGLTAVVLLVGLGGALTVRRRRRRELQVLRTRLARDLHDEIGSNLAAIAVISELGSAGGHTPSVAGGGEDWKEVNRIAHESMEGMREVLWLVGAREEAGPDLVTLLKRAAERMLSGMAVTWLAVPEHPPQWPAAVRREIFLFFKEALTNIVRHAGATSVELSLEQGASECRLVIRDHGCGMPQAPRSPGIGLASMRERARQLGGRMLIETRPGAGTTITLAIPLAKLIGSSAGGGVPAGV